MGQICNSQECNSQECNSLWDETKRIINKIFFGTYVKYILFQTLSKSKMKKRWKTSLGRKITWAPRHLQSFTKFLRQNLVFMGNSALRENFNFLFIKRLLVVLTKFPFWVEDYTLDNNFMKSSYFLDIF